MSPKKIDNTTSLLSQTELGQSLSRNIKERVLEQKLFYISDKMSEYYYDGVVITELLGQDYWSFLRKNLFKKEKTAIISLGCGNSMSEKQTLIQLKKEGYDFIYIGVDVSCHMLEMAKETLKDVDIEKIFIQADMTSEKFKDKMLKITKDYQKSLYVFIGGTFGNVNQTYMADVLYNLLKKDDLLWLDVVTRPSLKREDDIKLFKHYSMRLKDSSEIKFYFGPLENIGASLESGRMGLKVSGEESVGSLLFIFYFKFQKKTVVNFMKETIHFLPGEEVELISIRAYHPKTLIDFFTEHDFKLVDKKEKDRREQFMFKKK